MFATQKRAAFSANTLCQTLNALYKEAGLDGATSHSGRRSFITTLASKGVGERVLASLAVHRSIAITQAYIDVNDDMKRMAAELLGYFLVHWTVAIYWSVSVMGMTPFDKFIAEWA